MKEAEKPELLYPDLSYSIVGAAFEVFNTLGPGLQERSYHRAFENELGSRRIPFKSEVYVPVKYKDETVGSHYLDLVIDEKIICELKCGDYFRRQNIDQVVSYLQSTGLGLAILLNFTRNGVRQKRIVDPNLFPNSQTRKDPSNSHIRTD